jgi:hypothetical protein
LLVLFVLPDRSFEKIHWILELILHYFFIDLVPDGEYLKFIRVRTSHFLVWLTFIFINPEDLILFLVLYLALMDMFAIQTVLRGLLMRVLTKLVNFEGELAFQPVLVFLRVWVANWTRNDVFDALHKLKKEWVRLGLTYISIKSPLLGPILGWIGLHFGYIFFGVHCPKIAEGYLVERSHLLFHPSLLLGHLLSRQLILYGLSKVVVGMAQETEAILVLQRLWKLGVGGLVYLYSIPGWIRDL